MSSINSTTQCGRIWLESPPSQLPNQMALGHWTFSPAAATWGELSLKLQITLRAGLASIMELVNELYNIYVYIRLVCKISILQLCFCHRFWLNFKIHSVQTYFLLKVFSQFGGFLDSRFRCGAGSYLVKLLPTNSHVSFGKATNLPAPKKS